MIIKLENLTAEQYGKLSAFLAGEDNQLAPPSGFEKWADFSNDPRPDWVDKLQFARLVDASQKRKTFLVVLDLITECRVRIPKQPPAGNEFFMVSIPSEPLLKLFECISFYPPEFRGGMVKRTVIYPLKIVVSLYRAGSGDYAIIPPGLLPVC